jgi:hypothetical protein
MSSASFVASLQDDLQIPPTIRPKLAGMESSVKAAMLKSSKTIANTQPQTMRGLRRAHSTESLGSPKSAKKPADHDNLYHKAAGRTTVQPIPDDDSGRPKSRSRGKSIDIPRPKSRARGKSVDEGAKGKDKKVGISWTPSRFCTILDTTPSASLEVEIVKRLKLHLRNESARYSSFPLKRCRSVANLALPAGPKSSFRKVATILSSVVWVNCCSSSGERNNTTTNCFTLSWNLSRLSLLLPSDALPFARLSLPHSHS